MSKLSATSYFQNLSNLLSEIEITNQNGKAIPIDEAADMVAQMFLGLRDSENKAMIIGNGGSAAIAGHLQIDLTNSLGVKALVFYEPAMLTCLSNDFGYEKVFEKPILLWAAAEDILVAISSSGQSENILCGVQASLKRRCRVITLSGFDENNALRSMGHMNFYVKSREYGYVELAHAVLTHHFSDAARTHTQNRIGLH